MNRFILFTILLLGISGLGPSGVAKPKLPSSVTIGFIPGDDPEWLKKNGVELAKALQEKLGTQFNVYISKNYSGLVDAMKD